MTKDGQFGRLDFLEEQMMVAGHVGLSHLQRQSLVHRGAEGNLVVVAFVGDGGFSMLMAEFATCVKYQLPVKIVIVKNNTRERSGTPARRALIARSRWPAWCTGRPACLSDMAHLLADESPAAEEV
jgi:hypothetical protein